MTYEPWVLCEKHEVVILMHIDAIGVKYMLLLVLGPALTVGDLEAHPDAKPG